MAGRLERVRAWAEDAPLNLAVFRVTVGLVLLRLPDLHHAVRWAALPDRVRTAPVGLEWALGALPMTEAVARPLYWVVVIATVLGVLGLASRLAWSVVALASLYLLAIPQFAGSVFHYHHLVWFAFLLAASPCGDALSIDAWIARRRGRPPPPARALAYGVPIRAAWLLIGVIFFFPGLWKLLTGGWAWIWSDNLRNQMYAKWMQIPELVPAFRIDHYPTLLRLGALSVVVFELAFAGLVLHRRTRWIAVLLALAFHQATAELMGLRFPALWLCYVVFVDWEGVLRWLARRRGVVRAAPAAPRAPPSPRAALALAAVLLAGSAVFGAAGISDAWPFACYPKFDRLVRAVLPVLRVELVMHDESVREIPVLAMSPGGATQRWWALSWSLMGSHERARQHPERWQAFWRSIAQRPAVARLAAGARAVRFVKTMRSTVPEARAAPPLSALLLYELSLAPGTGRT